MKTLAVVSSLGALATLCATACSSSSTGSKGSPFEVPDASSDAVVVTTHDSGTGPKDTGSGAKVDASCGAVSGSGWCNVNAPAPTDQSYVQCDDFDTGQLQSIFGYAGVAKSSFVNTHYVSPFCALEVVVEDGGVGNAAAFGSYTEHPYSAIPGAGPATLAFDLYVSGGSACNGAAIARFEAESNGAQRGDDVGAWLVLSDVEGSGAAATAYTLGMTISVGLTGTPTTPVTVQVSPRASDEGWARVGMNISNYSFTTTTGTLTGKPTWAYRGSTGTPVGTSSAAATGTGTLASSSITGNMIFDVGLPPGPTSTLTSGCTLYVDDFVSNLPPASP